MPETATIIRDFYLEATEDGRCVKKVTPWRMDCPGKQKPPLKTGQRHHSSERREVPIEESQESDE